MATNITTVLRDSSANGLAEISALLAKLGATGTPATIFTTAVATQDDDRADSIFNAMKNDPRVSGVGYA